MIIGTIDIRIFLIPYVVPTPKPSKLTARAITTNANHDDISSPQLPYILYVEERLGYSSSAWLLLAFFTNVRATATDDKAFDHRTITKASFTFATVYVQLMLKHAHLTLTIYIGLE